MKSHKSKKQKYTKSLLFSVVLHILLIGALLFGSDFMQQTPSKPSGQMVEAVVIDPSLVHQQAKQIREQREAAAKKEQERLDKLRRDNEQLEKNRKAEEERLRQLKEQQAESAKAEREAEQKRQAEAAAEKERQEREKAAKLEAERQAKAEAEKQAKAEAEKKAQEQAKKAAAEKAAAEEKARKEREAAKQKAEQAAKEKAAAEKAAAEKAAKEKAAKEAAEKARLAREAAEKKEQDSALDDIFSGLESESAQQQAAQGQQRASEVARYSSIYTQLIQSRIIKDDYLLGKSCKVNIQLVPTGSDAVVSKVTVLGGDNRLCSAAKSAINQVGNFPMSKDPEVIKQLRNINLTVNF